MEQKVVGMPLLGDKFPEMTIKSTHGMLNLPDDYKGKWFVLFSHPGDFTPVCTTEFVAFAKRAEEFKAENAELIGLSVDQVFSHIKWVEWINENAGVTVPFPVIADELGRLATKLGMLHESMGTNTVRAVFIVDDKGILRLTMYYPQEVGRSVDEILRALKALKMHDKYGFAAPENYPNNSWIGEGKVILPPPGSEQEVEERKKLVAQDGYETKDWWLSFKQL